MFKQLARIRGLIGGYEQEKNHLIHWRNRSTALALSPQSSNQVGNV